jgi:fumarate reductase flavoprotein subunit
MPAQHYTMGGVRTNYRGESQGLKGLFAIGEASCWDIHGFNRLGGNSVAETVVAGMIVGEFIADFCDRADSDITITTSLVHEFLGREQARIDRLVDGRGSEDASRLQQRMQEVMTDKVGVFRDGSTLAAAVEELQQLLVRSRNIGLRDRSRGANPELATAYRTQKMLKVALCVAAGALARTESRGAHHRDDFPRRDDAKWLNRTLATWPNADDTLPTLKYEPLDVMRMELPPGWRGYGAKDFVPNPDSARRSADIEAMKKKLAGADRFTVQAALMPYEQLLPARLHGRNERIALPSEGA